MTPAAEPIAALIGASLFAGLGMAAHVLRDTRGLTAADWLQSFPFAYGADLWCAAGAVSGAALLAAIRALRQGSSGPASRSDWSGS